MREGDEIEVDREQHELDRHEQHDDVLAVEEDADHRDGEQRRSQHQEVRQRQLQRQQQHQASFSDVIFTRRTRPAGCARTCCAGSWPRESLRRRSVSEMAAMIATSSTTAAISKASTRNSAACTGLRAVMTQSAAASRIAPKT